MNRRQLVELSRVRQRVTSGAARTIRVDAGLSMAEVARSLRVSRASVLRWERGERVPRGPVALAYGRLLEGLVGKAPEPTGGLGNRQPPRSAVPDATLSGGPDVATNGATSPETRR
jgi:transcriptional regulator with XRE-family HTH domain